MSGRLRRAAGLALALGVACAPPPAPAVGGRVTRIAELELRWPEGWTLAVDPAHFRGGVPGTALEGRRGAMQLALSHHALPALPGLEAVGALDRLSWVSPAPGAAAAPGYRLRRLPGCWGAVERVLEAAPPEAHHALTQLALPLPSGLAVLHAWGDVDRPALRALACEHSRVAP